MYIIHVRVWCNRQHLDYLPKTKDIAIMYVTQILRIAWKFTTDTRVACKIASPYRLCQTWRTKRMYRVQCTVYTHCTLSKLLVSVGCCYSYGNRAYLNAVVDTVYDLSFSLSYSFFCISMCAPKFINNPAIENLKNKLGCCCSCFLGRAVVSRNIFVAKSNSGINDGNVLCYVWF